MWTLFINGVERGFANHSMTLDESLHHRTVLSFTLHTDGSYRPGRDDEVELFEDATIEFAGFVHKVVESGAGGEPIEDIKLVVHCVDLEYLADRRALVNTFFPEGDTLEDLLDTVAGHLATDGVTVDPAQVTGPTLPYISVPSMSVSQLLDTVTEMTGYVWEIYPSGANRYLRAYLPAATAAPFDVIDGTDPTVDDIKVEPSTEEYANRVVVQFGSGQREVIDHFVGDGSTTVFDLNYYPLIAHRGIVNVGGTVVDGVITGGVFETLSIGGGGTWDYNPTPSPPGTVGQVTRTSAVANGVDVWFQYTSQMPVVVVVEDTAEQPPVRDLLLPLPEIFDRASAEQAAQEALTSAVEQPVRVTYSTMDSGLAVGMSQHVTVAKRNVDADGYIEAIRHVQLEEDHVRRDVTWVEGDILQRYWGDVYTEWRIIGEGGGGGALPTTIVQAGPGAPVNSVQFNRNSTFGGDAAFTYDEVGNNLVMGEGSDITATTPTNCFIFGSNCHITD